MDTLFESNNDLNKFKLNVRDFLIDLKEFSGADNTELFAEETEKAREEARAAEREKALKVGGLMKPADLDQDDELWLSSELRAETAPGTRLENPQSRPQVGSGAPSVNDFDGWALYEL